MTPHNLRIARNTFFITGASIAQKVISFFYFVLIARGFGVAATGQYFFALSVSTIVSLFVDIGLSHVLIRETARDREHAPAQLQTLLGGKIILSAFAYGVIAVIAFLTVHDAVMTQLILLAGVVMLLDSWNFSLYSILRGYERLGYESIGIVLGQIVTLSVGGAALLLHAPLPWMIGALVAGSASHTLWSTYILWSRLGIRAFPRWDSVRLVSMLRMAIPFGLAGLFGKVYSYADGVLLGYLIDHTHVGWYSVAYKLTFAFQFLPMGFAASLFPAFSGLAKTQPDELGKSFTHSSFVLLYFALPISFGIFSTADLIIPFFYGAAYDAAIPVLQLLIFTVPFLFLTYPIGSLLNATYRQTIWTTMMGISMVINLALNGLLIPQWTMIGAAIAALASQAFLVVAGMVIVSRTAHLDLHEWLHTGIRAVVAVTAMTMVVISAKPYMHLVVLMALGGIVYVAALLVLRLVRIDEIMRLVRHRV